MNVDIEMRPTDVIRKEVCQRYGGKVVWVVPEGQVYTLNITNNEDAAIIVSIFIDGLNLFTRLPMPQKLDDLCAHPDRTKLFHLIEPDCEHEFDGWRVDDEHAEEMVTTTDTAVSEAAYHGVDHRPGVIDIVIVRLRDTAKKSAPTHTGDADAGMRFSCMTMTGNLFKSKKNVSPWWEKHGNICETVKDQMVHISVPYVTEEFLSTY